MHRMLALAAAIGVLLALPVAASAGSTKSTPGHMYQKYGSVSGHPGASGYSPGHKYRQYGSVRGHPGASGYAPGHNK